MSQWRARNAPVEIIRDRSREPVVLAAALDFDGTLSTLRAGWEKVVEPLMVELISGGNPPSGALIDSVRAYIRESAGMPSADLSCAVPGCGAFILLSGAGGKRPLEIPTWHAVRGRQQ